jgi:VanZ family protein
MRFLKFWAPVLLWAALILSAANDRFSDEKTEGLLVRLFGQVPPIVNLVARKSGHILEYAVLALLSWRARRTLATPLLIVFAVSCTDEILQARTLTRTGSPADVILDTCAGLLALLCLPAVRRHIEDLRRVGGFGGKEERGRRAEG